MLPPDELASLIDAAVKVAVLPLVKRIADLESRPVLVPRDGRDGLNGKDGAGLIGPMGEKGMQGERGTDGLRGADGAPGLNGKDGTGIADALLTKDGYLVLTLSDGSIRALGKVVGENGRDGENGTDGSNGKDGAQGPRGEPGLSVTGPRGEKGEPGPTGERGLEGPQGIAGRDGAAGLNGRDGGVGEKGADGLNGKDGVSITGPQGPRGDRGSDGSPGLNGKDAIFDRAELDAIVTRVNGIDTKLAALPVEVSPEDLAQQFAALLKKELDAIAPPVRMQKRIIRDAQGRPDRVVEEPVS